MGVDNHRGRSKPSWRVIDVVVRNDVAVEVSELPLNVPRYSFRVGTAYYPEIEGDPIKVGPRLTIFNAMDGAELLQEVAEKYTDIREARIQEVEDRKQRMRDPEVSHRRRSSD